MGKWTSDAIAIKSKRQKSVYMGIDTVTLRRVVERLQGKDWS